MTRPADPRGAARRGSDNADLGYSNVDDQAGPQRRQFQHKPRRVIPDCGCHGYDLHGVMYTRCQQHAPAGAIDCGPVLGQCVACAVM